MYKNSRRDIIYPLLLALAVVAGIFIGAYSVRDNSKAQIRMLARELSGQSNKLSYALQLIERKYVEEVDTDSLVELLMPDLMAELDPHSVYIPADMMAEANESLDGEFDGIGVVFNMATDTVIVLNVIPQGPSYKAGIQNGDRIITVDGTPVAGRGIAQNDIVGMLRGNRGTEVRIEVERQRIDGLVPITVVRDKIPLKSIDAAFMVTPDIGFVKLSAFSRTSHAELTEALERLRGEGMKKLIFDLRGNTGGIMDEPILIANEFLPEGRLIVYTEDRNGERYEQYSDGEGRWQDMELAVLIDEISASSSEILAGALQDNDRGVVVGRRSFGKGLVQQQLPFDDGSAIRLTVARYYTPTGRSIQKPYEKGGAGYEEDLLNRYLHNEYFSADSIRFADSLKFTTPGGRTVYGGGGIMPDIFVPLDTAAVTPYFVEVAGRNILYRYTMEYSDRRRETVNRIRTVAQLDSMLDADAGLLEDFVAYASRQGVKPAPEQIEKSKALLTAQLRAYIGRNTPLEDAGFYAEIYPIDGTVTTAIEELEK